ncbi:excinuclease ABC subunit B [Vallitaleaceae bacterium 9-2]
MLCEKCHKEQATVFFTQVLNGKKVEIHLCATCAKQQEDLFYGDNPSIQKFMSGLLKNSNDVEQEQIDQNLVCSKCHMTLDEFRKTSKLGCDACYDAFKPYVNHVLKSVQGSYRHTGKKPLRMNQSQLKEEQLEELESQLKLALMQEDYMEAARIRDALYKLKEE